MAASILDVRYQIRDLEEPYTFPDSFIQDALDAAAEFLTRKYRSQAIGTISNFNDQSLMPNITGAYFAGNPWYDYWVQSQYTITVDSPIGKKLQRMIAAVDLYSSMLGPSMDRTPTGVSEGGLSVQWGGDYAQAIQYWNDQIEKTMFALEAPMFVMYNNY